MLTVNDIKLYTAAEAMDLTGLSRYAILRLAIQGVIHPVMHGRRAMYRDDELRQLISGEIRPPRRPRLPGPYYLDPACTTPLPEGTEWLDTQDLAELGYVRRGISAALKRRHERHPGTVVFNAAGRRVGILKDAL